MMYTHLPTRVCNYATPTNEALLDYFDLQVENYSTTNY
jgi:hypothetical protein